VRGTFEAVEVDATPESFAHGLGAAVTA